MLTTWNKLFPNAAVAFPAPYQALTAVAHDEKAFEAASTSLESGLAVEVEGLPGSFYIMNCAIRLALPKKTLGRPADEVKEELAGLLEKKWGAPFDSKKRRIWLNEADGLRAVLYSSGHDGIFLEVESYTAVVPLLQQILDAAEGNKTIPFLGDPRATIKQAWPTAHDSDKTVSVAIGTIEIGLFSAHWEFDIGDDDEIVAVKIAANMYGAGTKLSGLVKPLLGKKKGRKDGKATFYDLGKVQLRVWDDAVTAVAT